MSCHTELSQESEVSIQNAENGLLNVAIKATKNEFSLEVAKLYERFKKERTFKIHSFRLALFATPLCRLNFLHQNAPQKLNSHTKNALQKLNSRAKSAF